MADDGKKASLFLPSNGELTPGDLDRILVSLVTYGDSIWLPASFNVAPLIEAERRKSIERTVDELREAGLVRLWGLERSGRLPRSPDLVLAVDEQRELLARIDESVFAQGQAADSPKDPASVDTASRYIEYRNELWNLGLAERFDASGLVVNTSAGESVAGQKYVSLAGRYSEELFSQFEIGSLAGLKIDDLAALRKSLATFRDRMDPIIRRAVEEGRDEEAIAAECRTLYNEYMGIVNGLLSDRVALVNRDVVYNVVGFLLPVVSVLPLAERLYNWMKSRDRYRFALYMHSVKRRSGEGRPLLRQ